MRFHSIRHLKGDQIVELTLTNSLHNEIATNAPMAFVKEITG